MKANETRPIIIKRKKKSHGHHGGAWKIAFADFMTAMMALFLVLWILAISDPQDRTAIAEYFRTPILVALAGGDKAAASTSAIPGGGPDPAYSEGEVRNIDLRQMSRSDVDREQLIELKRSLEHAIDLSEELAQIRNQIIIDLIPEGLRIQLVDSDNRPMFEIGSAKVAPYMGEVLRIMAPILNSIPNSIQISGHTDSREYAGGEKGYSNWELSADRANASRRLLVDGGLATEKLIRVSGMSDRLRFDNAGPLDAVNRRIAVIVLNRTAENAILNPEKIIVHPDELKPGFISR